jgi:hypothetical protein
MAYGERPTGCPPSVDAVEMVEGAWPADEPFPLTPEECWWLMRGYAVLPASGPMDADVRGRLPYRIELIEGRLVPS